MKVHKLVLENFMAITSATFDFDGKHAILSGPNGAGKSSVIDSIIYALSKTDAKIEDPIQHGKDLTIIRAYIGDIVAERRISPGNDKLKVYSKDGKVYDSPATLLNGFFDVICMDPLEYKNMKESEQRAYIIDLVGLSDKLEELQEECKAKEDERRLIGRDVKRVKGALEEHGDKKEVSEDYEDVDPSEFSASNDIERLESENKKLEEFRNSVKELEGLNKQKQRIIEKEIPDIDKQIEALKERKENLHDDIKEINDDINEISDEIKTFDEVKISQNIKSLKNDIKNFEEIKAILEHNKKADELLKDLERHQQAYDDYTKAIKDLRNEGRMLVNNADMPIDGLDVTADAILYKGTRFNDLSSSEQIRVSTAIAMAINPQMKFVLIKDGSLLDEKSKKIIFDMADNNDFQIIMEQVASGDEKTGFYIEDGELTYKNGEKL